MADLKEIEANDTIQSEEDVASFLRKNPNDKSDKALEYERIAFDLVPEYPDEETGWDNYFGPLAVFTDEGGKVREYPSKLGITKECVAYWDGRRNEAANPIFRARYADLVWEFGKGNVENKVRADAANLAIDTYLEMVQNQTDTSNFKGVRYLRRAFYLSIAVNDSDRLDRAREMILRNEREDFESGGSFYGYSFDLMISNKKARLTEEQEHDIIQKLEDRLGRLASGDFSGGHSPVDAEELTERLVKYHETRGKEDRKKEVLRKYYLATKHGAPKANHLAALTWLRNAYVTLSSHGMQSEAGDIEALMVEYEKKTRDQMKEVSTKVSIPQDEIDEYVSSFVSLPVADALEQIAIRFIPGEEDAKSSVQKKAKQFPIQYLIARELVDDDGRIIARIGSLQNDWEGHIFQEISQTLQFNSIFLRFVFEGLIESGNLNKKSVLEKLNESPVFSSIDQAFLDIGLDDYFAGNYAKAVFVLIHQVEAALRNLLEIIRSSRYRVGRYGGLILRSLGDMLSDPAVANTLGKDITLYLRVLLVDQRGWNLRNNICHGLIPYSQIDVKIADRILHVLLVLSLVKTRDPD